MAQLNLLVDYRSLSQSLSISLPTYLSIYPSICLFVCVSISLARSALDWLRKAEKLSEAADFVSLFGWHKWKYFHAIFWHCKLQCQRVKTTQQILRQQPNTHCYLCNPLICFLYETGCVSLTLAVWLIYANAVIYDSICGIVFKSNWGLRSVNQNQRLHKSG